MAASLRLLSRAASLANRFRPNPVSVSYLRHRSFQLYRQRLNFVNTGSAATATSLASGGPFSRVPKGRLCSTKATETETEQQDEEYHSIVTDTERGKGPGEKLEFQAETRKLLDIVAKSLYSEREVFIRELISNCSDALEKLRHLQVTGTQVDSPESQLEIHIATDDGKKTFTIQDTGIGMSKEDMVENLGTIAKSGSKKFMEEVGKEADPASAATNIIGQFGVGFYSTFMVGERVEVYSKSSEPGSQAYKWESDGTGTYELTEAEGVARGTKITVRLKGDCYDYAKEEVVKDIITKYSNFVGVPIYLNGKRINEVQALWRMNTREITPEMHEEFYRFIVSKYDKPRYALHYTADAPLNIRALFYVSEQKPSLYDMNRETDSGIALYSRKVMVVPKAEGLLPKWLRFVKGVVDSEDIPLNLSRELLQKSALVKKLQWVLTNRILKFFHESSRKDPEKYLQFYKDFGLFFREGILSSPEQETREEIAKLMRFESSELPAGDLTSLTEYGQRMKAGDRTIYYLSAPSRELAEASPYMEAIRERKLEVLFCYEGYDELVLMNLAQFDRKTLTSVESQLLQDTPSSSTPSDEAALTADQTEDLVSWLKQFLTFKVKDVKVTQRLSSHPCVVSVAEMGAMRHLLKTSLLDKTEEEKIQLMQVTLEINPSHPIIRRLSSLTSADAELAEMVSQQLLDSALVHAGLLSDPRAMVLRLNSLLSKALGGPSDTPDSTSEKHQASG